jgi:hypothetical protein
VNLRYCSRTDWPHLSHEGPATRPLALAPPAQDALPRPSGAALGGTPPSPQWPRRRRQSSGHTGPVSGGSADAVRVICTLTGVSSPSVPAARSSQRPSMARTPRRMRSHRSTPGRLSSPPFRPSARSRVPPMPSADFCRAVREDCSALSPLTGHPTDLLRYAVIPSVHRRRIDQVRRACGWRTLWWRAHSSRAYHTSDPVCVPRPARSFHAAFRPHLAVTPWRFPCPSAPRTPGRGTCTPEHDSMHGTHTHEQRRGKSHPQPLAGPSSHSPPLFPRPLQCVVRPAYGIVWTCGYATILGSTVMSAQL